jgi:hypothetical protein
VYSTTAVLEASFFTALLSRPPAFSMPFVKPAKVAARRGSTNLTEIWSLVSRGWYLVSSIRTDWLKKGGKAGKFSDKSCGFFVESAVAQGYGGQELGDFGENCNHGLHRLTQIFWH